jgi:hypothetical protein
MAYFPVSNRRRKMRLNVPGKDWVWLYRYYWRIKPYPKTPISLHSEAPEASAESFHVKVKTSWSQLTSLKNRFQSAYEHRYYAANTLCRSAVQSASGGFED